MHPGEARYAYRGEVYYPTAWALASRGLGFYPGDIPSIFTWWAGGRPIEVDVASMYRAIAAQWGFIARGFNIDPRLPMVFAFRASPISDGLDDPFTGRAASSSTSICYMEYGSMRCGTLEQNMMFRVYNASGAEVFSMAGSYRPGDPYGQAALSRFEGFVDNIDVGSRWWAPIYRVEVFKELEEPIEGEVRFYVAAAVPARDIYFDGAKRYTFTGTLIIAIYACAKIDTGGDRPIERCGYRIRDSEGNIIDIYRPELLTVLQLGGFYRAAPIDTGAQRPLQYTVYFDTGRYNPFRSPIEVSIGAPGMRIKNITVEAIYAPPIVGVKYRVWRSLEVEQHLNVLSWYPEDGEPDYWRLPKRGEPLMWLGLDDYPMSSDPDAPSWDPPMVRTIASAPPAGFAFVAIPIRSG